jgi:hypothetical protein
VIVTVTGVPTGAVSFCEVGAGGASEEPGAAPGAPGAEAVLGFGAASGLAGAVAAVGAGAVAGAGAACGVEPSEFGTCVGVVGAVDLLHPPETRTAQIARVTA